MPFWTSPQLFLLPLLYASFVLIFEIALPDRHPELQLFVLTCAACGLRCVAIIDKPRAVMYDLHGSGNQVQQLRSV